MSLKFKDITVITISNKIKSKLNKNIKIKSYQNDILEKFGRRKKFILCLFILIKELLFDRNNVVLSFQGNVYCTLICRLFFVKIIIRSNTSPSGWSKNYFKFFLYKFFYGLADKIIVNSNQFKKELNKKFNLDADCIYNPLNKNEIINLSKKKIKFKYFKKSYLNIISIARLNDQKDHFCILNAISKLKGKIKIKVLFMGNGKLLKNIKNDINEKRLHKIVKIINFKKNPFPYLSQSDLFILSSKFEGLPNVLLEALVMKKMIISSDCPTGPREILDNGKGGLLFKTGDVDDLVKKINFFTRNKKISNRKINYGFKRLHRFEEKLNLNKYFLLLSKFQIKLK